MDESLQIRIQTAGDTDAILQIISTEGIIKKEKLITNFEKEIIENINLEGFSSGIYMLKITTTSGYNKNIRFIIK